MRSTERLRREGIIEPNRFDSRALRAAAWILSGAVSLGPFWQTFTFTRLSAVTVGRAALIVAGLLSVAAVVSRHGPRGRPPWTITALTSLLALGTGLIVFSASRAGCFCAGALPGFVELAATAVLVATLCSIHPSARKALLLAVAVGVVVAAALGLLDVSNIHSHINQDLQPIGDRLTGPYGNPNVLAFALACGAPVLLVSALGQRNRRLAIAGVFAFAVVATALVLTYSRGAILGATAGIATGFSTLAPVAGWPRSRVLLGAAVAAALVAVAYPSFNDARTRADFGEADSSGNPWDRGGWDGRAQGPIPRGPSMLESDMPDTLTIESDQAGEGASFPLGALREGSVVSVSFRATARGPYVPITYALQDNLRVLTKTAQATGALSGAERQFSLSWRVPARVRNARFYVWQTSGASTINVLSLSRRTHRGASVVSVPLDLLGEVHQGEVDPAANEERFIQSRIDAADAAIKAFAGAPLEGIGWQRFPDYARGEIGYRIATHNEYLRFAAELGAPGLLVLCLIVLTLVLSTASIGPRAEKAVVAGGLVAGGVGLLFVNALVLPASALPLAVLAGVSAGSRRWK